MSLFLIFGSHSFLILVRRNFSIFGICFSKPISLALSNIQESIPERGIIGIKPDSKTYVFNFLIIVEGKIKGYIDSETQEIFSLIAIFERILVKIKFFSFKFLPASIL